MLTGTAGLIENQIKNWCRKIICAVDKDNGRCKKIVLRHLSVDRKPIGDVHNITLTGDPALEGLEVVDRVILEIAEAAQRDADDVNQGVQTYAIYAYHTNPNYVPRKIFRVAAQDEIERDVSGPSEPPTEKGLTAQLMRHLEVVSKNSLVGMGYILQTFQKEIQEQRAQNKIFLEQQIDMTMLIQEVLNESSKRRLEEKQSELQVSVIEGIFEHLKYVLPIIANRIAGKKAIPEKLDKDLYLLATLLENLSPDQQQTLQNMLEPKQLALLGEILGRYEKKKDQFLGKKENASGEPDGGSNKLLTMFESRRSLVNSGEAAQIEDERTRRIESRAQKIRDSMKKVKESLHAGENEDS